MLSYANDMGCTRPHCGSRTGIALGGTFARRASAKGRRAVSCGAALARAWTTGALPWQGRDRRGTGPETGHARRRHPTRTPGRASPVGARRRRPGRETVIWTRSCDSVCHRTRAAAPGPVVRGAEVAHASRRFGRRLQPKNLVSGLFQRGLWRTAGTPAHSPRECTPRHRPHAASARDRCLRHATCHPAIPTTLRCRLLLTAR